MLPLADHPESIRFAELAEAFCGLVDNRARINIEEFLRALQRQLATLYAAGLSLPAEAVAAPDDSEDEEPELGSPEMDPDRGENDEWHSLFISLGQVFGSRNHYREIFDPYEPETEKPVVGSLADDVADIYRDLADGRAKWRRGEREDAVWTWRFHFQSHWGEHALGALRAIHSQASLYELGWPSSGASDA